MKRLNLCIEELFRSNTVKNLIVRVGNRDRVFCDIKRSSEGRILTDTTLFDMASVTKIIATTPLFFIASDRGLISKNDPVSKFFAVPEDKRDLTVWNLLTHTMGIGHKSMVKAGYSYENVQNYVLSIPLDIPIGSDVLYSCPGYVLLGKILEEVLAGSLDKLFAELVAKPIGMKYTTFLPHQTLDIVNSNDSQRELGLVNDYNCRYLGGVAGSAGLFSCIEDVMRYVHVLLSYGAPLFSKEIFLDAIKNHTPTMEENRGLGFLYVGEAYEQTASLFPIGSIGHCGHTGQSVFVNPENGLYAIVLSDATLCAGKKYGDGYYDVVKKMRHDIHEAIKEDIR